MRSYSVSLDQVLRARERRVDLQNKMLKDAGQGCCLVCLTLNIAGDIKRTPMTRMLFDRGMADLGSLCFNIVDNYVLDDITGTEAFWLLCEDASYVKRKLEAAEDAFPAARLYDFDVLMPGGQKLSRSISRRCLVCDAPAVECARSRRHGLDAVRSATGELLKEFCASELAAAACDSLLDELYTTPKPGLVDMMNCGAHTDMDVPLFEKSAECLRPYFHDAAMLGMNGCSMKELRERGLAAEKEMFDATGGVNTHKGLIYSMGLFLAGMGRTLAEASKKSDEKGEVTADTAVRFASALALEDAEKMLAISAAEPATNGGTVYSRYGIKGAIGEAASGFPDALYCYSRLTAYRAAGYGNPGALAFCDSMAVLDDTNLLHRGGPEGLAFARKAAGDITALPADKREEALKKLDTEMISRDLSPGGSADMLALAYLIERWHGLYGYDLYDIAEGFSVEGQVRSIRPVGNGHINDTYLVECGPDGEGHRYILQRINHEVFHDPMQLMENIVTVTEHLRKKILAEGGDPQRETISVIPARDGGILQISDGRYWRMISFIENTYTCEVVESAEEFIEAGCAFGQFQARLADLPAGSLHETIPGFHDTRLRFSELIRTIKEDPEKRVKTAQPEIDFVMEREYIADLLNDRIRAGEVPLRVTHNDTKINNVLMDRDTGKAICVIDLDTVMPGYAVNDFGDAIRSGACTGKEDESDPARISLDLCLFRSFAQGFIKGCRGSLTADEIQLLPEGALVMTFECGLRFLTDYLQGDRYFKTDYDTHNLVRCRTQLRLALDMEQKLPQMHEAIRTLDWWRNNEQLCSTGNTNMV